MVYRPDAPPESVSHVLSAFRGKQHYLCPGNWLVELPSAKSASQVGLLVNGLQGWKTEPHPTRPNMLRMQGPVKSQP